MPTDPVFGPNQIGPHPDFDKLIGANRIQGATRLPSGREGTVIRTKLTERYGLKLPFVSAGMGFIALLSLAAALSDAGGLGQLACGAAPAAVLHEMIIATRDRTSLTLCCQLRNRNYSLRAANHRVPVVAFHWASPP
jgi:hypothetical protein